MVSWVELDCDSEPEGAEEDSNCWDDAQVAFSTGISTSVVLNWYECSPLVSVLALFSTGTSVLHWY